MPRDFKRSERVAGSLRRELAKIIQFSPAQVGGYPVPVWVTVPINLTHPLLGVR